MGGEEGDDGVGRHRAPRHRPPLPCCHHLQPGTQHDGEPLFAYLPGALHPSQAVERALQKDLDEWVIGRTRRRKRSSQDEPSVIAQFMEERFHLREDESIFDVLKALALPAENVTNSVATNAVRSIP